MELATLLYAALLVFHPSWQDGFCDGVGETRLAKCEEGVERGQLHLEDFTRVLANECELKEGQGVKLDCLLMGIVAEKESSLGDEAPGQISFDSDGICQSTYRNERVVAIEPREGDHYCELTATILRRGSDNRSLTRNVHLIRQSETSMTFDTCCARERGYYQLLPANFPAGHRVTLPVGNGCGSYDGNTDFCQDGQFVFPRAYSERLNFADRLEWNIALGVEEVIEHIEICHLDEDEHPILGVAAYNQGDCTHDDGFETYFSGVRSRYVRGCDAILDDGTKVRDHWDGCEDVPRLDDD